VRYRALVFVDLLTLGEGDCEFVGGGWLAQPTNAISSLAYAAVGFLLVPWALSPPGRERVIRILTAAGLVVTGLGSFMYHGPQGPGSQLAHDLSFLLVLVVVSVANLATGMRWSDRTLAGAILAVGASFTLLLVVAPSATNVAAAGAIALVGAGDVSIHRLGPRHMPWYAVAIGCIVVAVPIYVLSRTGAWWCDPASVFQGHAAWHILGAVAIGSYAVATGSIRIRNDR
jgi:drug/metabolite transporter (DMT)-like permease